MKRIGVLTSGGDAPGLNAVIAAVVNTAHTWPSLVEVVGYIDGFEGVIRRERVVLTPESVRGISRQAGSILGCGQRCNPWNWKEEDRSFDAQTELLDLDGLIVIGGNGTMGIAHDIEANFGTRVIGVPKTIDNDIVGTDETFGFDTAVSAVTATLDSLHATGSAHRRIFVVETMGRDAGHIALSAGLAGEADLILIPEIAAKIDTVAATVQAKMDAGQRSQIIVAAEGADIDTDPGVGGIAAQVTAALADRLEGADIRTLVVGHTQRGNAPTPHDRELALSLGAEATRLLLGGTTGEMVAIRDSRLATVLLYKIAKHTRYIAASDPRLANARLMGLTFGGVI